MLGIQVPTTIQWGLEFRTLEYRIHSKTERFDVLISNVRISNGPYHSKTEHLNIQNGRFKLGCFKYKKFLLYI